MGKTANKQIICEVLMEAAKEDKDIVALCSDSRGSGSFTPFADTYPEQFVETGIAEQNLVSIAAGLAKCGKKSYAVSPACFLSTRSYEQCKVDVAYSNTNVKLIGISGGVSYGALGMSHHSAQDIAAMSAIPNMRVYIPSDHLQTRELTKALLKDEKPAYIRVGRNAVDPTYEEDNVPFEMDHATVVTEGNTNGNDVAIIACGEMVKPAKDAARLLKAEGISASVLDMYCIKPLDEEAIVRMAGNAKAVLTVEEHAPFGGLGSMVAQVTGRECPKKVVNMSLPDASVITGTSKEVFDYYGLNAEGIANKAKEILAFELTKLVHGEEEAAKAQESARALFSGGNAANMPTAVITEENLRDGEIDIMGLLVASGLCASRSEARRAVQQGGVAVNGEKVGSIEASYKPEDINKEDFVLRRGKKNYRKIIFE